ncbi:MAG: hypothetical protein PUP93_20340 [Rhizonema sp. NSF051]|nr:hypothetical protein [Rhizonema sp. NSF051]
MVKMKLFCGGSFLGLLKEKELPEVGDKIQSNLGEFVVYIVLGLDPDGWFIVGVNTVNPMIGRSKKIKCPASLINRRANSLN